MEDDTLVHFFQQSIIPNRGKQFKKINCKKT